MSQEDIPMRHLALSVAALALLLPGVAAHAQIGTMVPDARLPIVTSSPRVLEWQDAGYFRHLNGAPIVYTLLVDVTTLGAVGDGVTINNTAFNTAINQAAAEAANGGFTIIYVPAGTYAFNAPLNLPSNTVLKGAGSTATTLAFTLTTGNAINVNGRTNTGIEDLKMTMATGNNKNGFTGNLISYTNTVDGYVRGVHTFKPARNHIRLVNSQNIEVRDSFIDDAQDVGGGGNGYGVELDSGSVKCLVENNVFRKLRHSMILQTDCHFNVFGYNYSTQQIRSETPTDWASDITLHGSWDTNRGGPYLNLFEGNRVQFIAADDSHGANGNYNLFFRNESNYLGIRIANTTSNQSMVNNFFRCTNVFWTIQGYPWVVPSNKGHWFKNNRTLKGSTTTWRDSQNSTYFNDVSYYLEAKPAFFGSAPWPHEPYSQTIPAETRGWTAITAGWSGYTP
jgi:hypothetical protein